MLLDYCESTGPDEPGFWTNLTLDRGLRIMITVTQNIVVEKQVSTRWGGWQ